MSSKIKDWIKGQIPQKAMEDIKSLFEDGVDVKKTPEEKKLEDKFKPDNFDLITWFVVTGKKNRGRLYGQTGKDSILARYL